MKSTTSIGALALVLFVMSTPAMSANWHYLKDNGPVTSLSEKDFDIFQQAARNSLNNKDDGATVSWKNPETGSHGTFTPLSTYKEDGTTCRSIKMISHAKGRIGKGFFNFCRQRDNTWKVDIQ